MVEEPWFVAMIDDADGYVYAEFHHSEKVWANMKVIRAYIEKRGIFMALYTDKASHFSSPWHGGIHYHNLIFSKRQPRKVNKDNTVKE